MMKRNILLMLLTLVICTVAGAQFEAGSIVGVVTDPSGAVISKAPIELRGLATNVVRQATTSSAGAFDFVEVPPGQYSIIVKQAGYKERTQDFELVVGQRLELNMELEVGTQNQSVTVSADVETLETASSEI